MQLLRGRNRRLSDAKWLWRIEKGIQIYQIHCGHMMRWGLFSLNPSTTSWLLALTRFMSLVVIS